MARFLVMNIGCIECGVSSGVVGIYETEQEAENISRICSEKLYWREGGQNSFEVFDLEANQADEYAEALQADAK